MPGHFHFFTYEIVQNTAFFDEKESRHICEVLRYKIGDAISFTDGRGMVYSGILSATDKKRASAAISDAAQQNKEKSLTLICAMQKNADRMEWMVEKCTELGVVKIIFVPTTNSQRGRLNLSRLGKVSLSALKQSHGAWLPELAEMSWKELMKTSFENKYVAALFGSPMLAWSRECVKDLKTATIFIGPEGDFTPDEMHSLMDGGFRPVQLGSAILRTETAAIAAVSVFLL